MNIIFGDSIKDIPDSFTVLELDSFKYPDRVDTAYCIIEKLPLEEMATLDAYKKIHADLIKFYKQKEWTYCEHAIEGLMGKWNKELDTFYLSLLARILSFKETPPDDSWDGSLVRTPSV